MFFVIGLLTFFMVLDCIVLVLLVLIQLPKKEAGVGLAFGGAASDALFGAGSGNVLTKITKYAATIFFVMAVLLSVLQSRVYGGSGTSFQKKLISGPSIPSSPVLPPNSAAPITPLTSSAALTNAAPEATNVPATTGSNEAPKK
jgi:preprotein translocase subunit SecG